MLDGWAHGKMLPAGAIYPATAVMNDTPLGPAARMGHPCAWIYEPNLYHHPSLRQTGRADYRDKKGRGREEFKVRSVTKTGRGDGSAGEWPIFGGVADIK